MEFRYLVILYSIPFFLLLGFIFKYRGGFAGARIKHSSGGKKISGLRLIIDRTKTLLYIFTIVMAIFASAWPLGDTIKKEKRAEVHKIILAIDASGSMMGSNLHEVVRIAKKFVLERKGDLIGIIPFEDRVIEDYRVSLTTDTEYLTKSLDRLAKHHGGLTGIGEAMFDGIVSLLESALKSNEAIDFSALYDGVNGSAWNEYTLNVMRNMAGQENASILVLTDSGNNSGIDPIKVLELARELNILVSAIRINVYGDEDFKKAIKEIGGKAYDAKNISEVAACYDDFSRMRKKKEIIEIIPFKRPLYKYFLAASLLSLFALIVLEWIKTRIPGGII